MSIENLTKALKEHAANYKTIISSAAASSSSTSIKNSVGEKGKNDKADVTLVQKLLNSNANAKLVVDGDCGAKSIAAIRKFQKEEVGLPTQDGRIDPDGKTWNFLIGKGATPATPTPATPVAATPALAATSNKISAAVGDNCPNVKADVTLVQTLLNTRNKSYALATDGSCGAKTIAAIKHFQKNAAGLPSPDGVISPDGKTWKTLTGATPATAAPAAPAAGNTAGGKMDKPKWVTIAEGEIGVTENKAAGKHNPKIVEYHAATSGKFKDDETAWCSSFMNWVMAKAGESTTNSAMARSWANWGKKINKPAYGALAVFGYSGSSGHVGIVVGKKGSNLLILGGNQSDQVKISSFATGKIIAYVVPKNYEVPAANYQFGEIDGDFEEGGYANSR